MIENNNNLIKIPILLNSTNSFADCWPPFFTLFKEYWPEFNGSIYLNAESKSYTVEGLEIIPLLDIRKLNLNWSDCLKYALDKIDDEIVLYLQEDYFFKGKVDNELVKYFYKLISSDSKIGILHLTDQSTSGPFEKTPNENLVKTSMKAPYLVSTQAAFWRKDFLLEIISKNESAWQYEQYGTKKVRLLKTGYGIYNVNPAIYGINKKTIIPYVFTGIIKNKWNPEVTSLFNQHNIFIDYNLRGFISDQEKPLKRFSIEYLRHQINRIPSELNILKIWLCRN
jgi:hypothetical protein